MKRIEFIAPVESIRGNMSGRQDLRYAENDNKAFEGPQGTRNYARNYSPRFIGAKISASGRKYFAVKTKSASRLTTKSLKAMALLGGAGAIYASMIRRQDLTPYTSMMRLYEYNIDRLGYTSSFRRFVMDFLRNGLQNKVQNFTANVASISVSFKNPWYDGSMTDGATVTNGILVKFWQQLAVNGIKFTVDGQIGIANSGDTFAQVIANSNTNVLHLVATPVGQNISAVSMGDVANRLYLMLGDEYVYTTDEVAAGAKYTLTSVAPQP